MLEEEDGDPEHGSAKSNIVRTWKEKNGLESISIITIFLILPLEYVGKYCKTGSSQISTLR